MSQPARSPASLGQTAAWGNVLDGDGYVATVGEGEARRLADEAADRARGHLDALNADTEVLEEIVNSLAVRTT